MKGEGDRKRVMREEVGRERRKGGSEGGREGGQEEGRERESNLGNRVLASRGIQTDK